MYKLKPMLDYKLFRESVLKNIGEADTSQNNILEGIPPAYRKRYLYLLEKGFDINTSHKILLFCQKMNHEEFQVYLEQVMLSGLGY